MADPYLFNRAFGGGLQTGSAISDLFRQGRERRQLTDLAQLIGAGDYQQAGADLVGMGRVGEGLTAAQIPYHQEQQRLQQEFQNAQFIDNRDFRRQQFDWQRAESEKDNAFRQSEADWRRGQAAMPDIPAGYMLNDPSDASQGVSPVPGLPAYKPSPSSPIGKIQADFEAGLIDRQTRDAAMAKATQSNAGITVNPDGTVQIGGPAKAATEGQSKANIYATRGEASNKILDRLETQGTDLAQSLVSGAPLGNYALTPAYRQYEQAQRDFVNAVLRQESGAVISPAEFENAKKQYFPQPGDDPGTIAQKRQNRTIALDSIREASGPFMMKRTGPSQNVPTPEKAGKTREAAIPIANEADADALPPGTWINLNGRVGRVK